MSEIDVNVNPAINRSLTFGFGEKGTIKMIFEFSGFEDMREEDKDDLVYSIGVILKEEFGS